MLLDTNETRDILYPLHRFPRTKSDTRNLDATFGMFEVETQDLRYYHGIGRDTSQTRRRYRNMIRVRRKSTFLASQSLCIPSRAMLPYPTNHVAPRVSI